MQLTKNAQERLTNAFDPLIKRIHKAEAQIQPIELDEAIFVRVFLPFFAGEKELMYFKDDEAGTATEKAITVWINTAQGPYNDVNVVRMGPNGKEVLFTVPAVLSRNNAKPSVKNDNEPSIYGAVLTAGNIVHHSPRHAEHYLQDYLKRRASRMWVPDQLVRNAEAWNKIFAFYGRPPLVASVAGEATPDQKSDEVIGFDPL
jgi:hypothetical protein